MLLFPLFSIFPPTTPTPPTHTHTPTTHNYTSSLAKCFFFLFQFSFFFSTIPTHQFQPPLPFCIPALLLWFFLYTHTHLFYHYHTPPSKHPDAQTTLLLLHHPIQTQPTTTRTDTPNHHAYYSSLPTFATHSHVHHIPPLPQTCSFCLKMFCLLNNMFVMLVARFFFFSLFYFLPPLLPGKCRRLFSFHHLTLYCPRPMQMHTHKTPHYPTH